MEPELPSQTDHARSQDVGALGNASSAMTQASTGAPLILAADLAPLAQSVAQGMAQDASKRKVKKACFLCKNAHACCDFNRPCSRCIKNGMAEVCFDTEGKKRGRKTKAQKAAEAIMRIHGDIGTESPRPLGNPTSPRVQVPQLTQLASPVLKAAAAPDELDSPDIAPAVGRAQAANQQQLSPGGTDPSSALTTTAPQISLQRKLDRDRTLTDVNRMLLSEIRELKQDQEKLYAEIRALKEQQQQRQATTAVAQQAPAMTISTNNDQQSAVVVYDLTKKPAVVQSANAAFCRMLGYSVEEAHGASWHKFVYPPYVDRALAILSKHMVPREKQQATSSVTFEQVYQHKNGTLVRTVDSHNIFFIDGQPTSDVITVSPLLSHGPLPSISLESSAPSTDSTAHTLQRSFLM